MPSDIATNNALILTLINRMDSLEATINNAVTVAVATALQASEARVARNEERITQLVQQLDETNHKFDAKYNQLERKFDEKTRALERALLRLHGQQDNHKQKKVSDGTSASKTFRLTRTRKVKPTTSFVPKSRFTLC